MDLHNRAASSVATDTSSALGYIAIGKARMLGSFEGGKPWSWAEIPNWTRPEEVPRHLGTAQVISLVTRRIDIHLADSCRGTRGPHLSLPRNWIVTRRAG